MLFDIINFGYFEEIIGGSRSMIRRLMSLSKRRWLFGLEVKSREEKSIKFLNFIFIGRVNRIGG